MVDANALASLQIGDVLFDHRWTGACKRAQTLALATIHQATTECLGDDVLMEHVVTTRTGERGLPVRLKLAELHHVSLRR